MKDTEDERRINQLTSEIVPEDDFERQLQKSGDKTVYIGYEPSGILHLGHMVTANALIELQDLGFDVKILIADLHAELNGKGSSEEMKSIGETMENQLLKFGLSEETEFVYGSDFQMNEEYQRMVQNLCQHTTSNRAKRAMSEIAGDDSTTVSHLLYPVMQVADIWWLDVDIALGGMEQRKVHMLSRDIFPKENIEKPVFIHTPLIADLENGDGKMSSSSGVSISSADSPETVEQKISSAYCPTDDKDKENPILQIYNYHIFPRIEEVKVERDEDYGGNVVYSRYQDLEEDMYSDELHPQDAKETLAKELNKILEPLREIHQ